MADIMDGVPRGDRTKYLRQQRGPQAAWLPVADILKSAPLSYDPNNPGKKILVGAIDQQLIGIADNRHMMTVAGSRAGKSVSLINNLLFYRGSILATDPKGELAEVTAHRRAAMGQKVYVLDPFLTCSDKVAGFRASYNPMSVLDPSGQSFLEDAALIAESIVVQAGDQKDPHWDESAKNFIEGVVIHVATAPQYKDRRHLVTVRDQITKALWVPPNDETDAARKRRAPKPLLYEEMQRNASDLRDVESTADIGASLMAAVLDFYSKGEQEIAGVQSTVNRQTKFLDYPALRGVLQKSDFDLAELKRNPKGVSIYLCFPATRSEISKRWMRLFVNQLLDAMARERTEPPLPVLVCLDEFPVLGYMKQLETAAGLIASFGVKLWFILQDWSQGKALYGDRWETFAGNAGILQFFGNNDLTTAEYISKRLGKTQVQVFRQGEVVQDQKNQGMSGQSENVELHDLLAPNEVMLLFARSDSLKRQLILWAGYHPMILQRVEHHAKGNPLERYL